MFYFKNERGFTLIEMMIVLLIISVLILVAIPNVAKSSKSIDEKGCNAYVKMVQGQTEAYKLEKNQYPQSLNDLLKEDYLPKEPAIPVCPDGRAIDIKDGVVVILPEGSGTEE